MKTSAPSPQSVLALLTDKVNLIQIASGRAAVSLSMNSDLLNDVDGFDSLNLIELAVQAGADLGTEIPDDVVLPDKAASTKLRLGDLVNKLVLYLRGIANA